MWMKESYWLNKKLHGLDFTTQNLEEEESKMKEDWKECKLSEIMDLKKYCLFMVEGLLRR